MTDDTEKQARSKPAASGEKIKSAAAGEKAERLAARLRENLRKRKEQARAREKDGGRE
ncbi:hypothetical protein [Azospirillum thermophilum]|uniref:hypothetical protein n=1 Tax=Azospirillum thermophilum TaxID=2202148 RepID=UPI00143DDCF4|nr:hypothetical protein [Azospirillum thermophilum]